ncbi:hypothetical protein APHAL10511_000343 [Amanita phalloides]|nr:hypothetical protein APHAL10511_000343 [Amanita phalloides]
MGPNAAAQTPPQKWEVIPPLRAQPNLNSMAEVKVLLGTAARPSLNLDADGNEKPRKGEASVAGPSKGKATEKDKVVTTEVINTATNEESIADVKQDESAQTAFINFLKILTKPPVLIMVCAYACSLGIQLAIDNVIGQVFEKKVGLNPSRAAYIGSIFGLLNIYSRLSGGLFSDFMACHFHMSGRILALQMGMLLEGAFLISFSFGLVSLGMSIVQAVWCGLTYGIVPFIDPLNTGKVMGIVGAGGNFGDLNLQSSISCSAGLVLVMHPHSFPLGVCLLRRRCDWVRLVTCAKNKTIWHLYGRRYL